MKYINLKISMLVGDKCFLKNDFKSFNIFFDYFLHRPAFKCKYYVYIFNVFVYFSALIFFKTKINLLFSKEETDEFLIKKIGSGNYPNIIILKKGDQGKFLIRKVFYNKNILENEQEYYLKYYNNESKITIPNFVFDEDYLEYNFINHPSLKMEINSGVYSKKQIINIFEQISFSLDILYRKNKCLIHGDLTPDNIYFLNNKIYFIDYSDSENYFKDYDKFTLLKKILEKYSKNNNELIYYLEKYNLNKKLFWEHLKQKKYKKHNK